MTSLTLYPGDHLCDLQGKHVLDDMGKAVVVDSETVVEMQDEEALQSALEHTTSHRERNNSAAQHHIDMSQYKDLSRDDRLNKIAVQIEDLRKLLVTVSGEKNDSLW
jgi:hypothetical protein